MEGEAVAPDEHATIHGIGVPLARAEVDTDAMYPAEFEVTALQKGYGAAFFGRWRLNEPEFPLNRPEYENGSVLFAGPDFGIGSSREQAVWALAGWGIRAVFSSRFGDIFRSNCARNRIVAGLMETEDVDAFLARLTGKPGMEVVVDLRTLRVETADGRTSASFAMDSFAREAMLSGVREVDVLLARVPDIGRYEQGRPQWMPTIGDPAGR